MLPIPCGFYKKRRKAELYVERALTESYSSMETNLSQISRPKCFLLYKCKGVGEKCLEFIGLSTITNKENIFGT